MVNGGHHFEQHMGRNASPSGNVWPPDQTDEFMDPVMDAGRFELSYFVNKMHRLQSDISRDFIFALTTDAANLTTKNMGQQLLNEILRFFERSDSPKLGILYLIDSFLKKFGTQFLPELYEQYLPDLFCKAFLHDEHIRTHLYNLRKSWNRLFNDDYLDSIDIRIYHLDKKWPLRNPQVNEIYEKRFNPIKIDAPRSKIGFDFESTHERDDDEITSAFYNHCHHLVPIIKRHEAVNREFTINIGSKSYKFILGQSPLKIDVNNRVIVVEISKTSMKLLIDEKPIYDLYSIPVTFEGLNIYYQGQEIQIYINDRLYVLHHYAPPTFIPLNEKIFKFQLIDFGLFINDSKVCEAYSENICQIINNVSISIGFYPPPSPIINKDEKLTIVFHSYFPLVGTKKNMIAYFIGENPITVLFDDMVHHLKPCTISKVEINNVIYSVSIGGPFFELIIDGIWFSINFDGKSHKIKIENNEFFVLLVPPAPSLEFIDCPDFIANRSLPISPIDIGKEESVHDKSNLLDLMTKLSDHGLLSNNLQPKFATNNLEVPADLPDRKSDENIPDYTTFDENLLSAFSELSLQDLMKFICCHECGKSFMRDDLIGLQDHLENHSSPNDQQINSKCDSNILRSCQAYFTLPEWIHHGLKVEEDILDSEENFSYIQNKDQVKKLSNDSGLNKKSNDSISTANSELNNKVDTSYVVVDDSDCVTDVCCACGEKLDHRWSDTFEKWIVYDSKIINNEIYHIGCI